MLIGHDLIYVIWYQILSLPGSARQEWMIYRTTEGRGWAHSWNLIMWLEVILPQLIII